RRACMLCVERLRARIRASCKKRDSARVVRLNQELESQHPNLFEPREYTRQHRRRIAATVKLGRDRERSEMRNMVRPAGQTRGLAEADDRTVDLVYEEITALEQAPEDSSESVLIDAIERQKPFNEFVCVD